MHKSHIPLRKWAIAIYLHLTSLKGVSSMKLHRDDIGVSQAAAWYMLHRIRKAWESREPLFQGPLEVDETYIGGKEGNKHEHKKLKSGRGAVGKAAVAGARDRNTKKIKASVIGNTDRRTLKNFVMAAALTGATVYTDDHARACRSDMKLLNTASASMSATRRISTASNHSGRCSSVGTMAPTTT